MTLIETGGKAVFQLSGSLRPTTADLIARTRPADGSRPQTGYKTPRL